MMSDMICGEEGIIHYISVNTFFNLWILITWRADRLKHTSLLNLIPLFLASSSVSHFFFLISSSKIETDLSFPLLINIGVNFPIIYYHRKIIDDSKCHLMALI